MTTAEFRKYYKTISLGELLDIVDNPDHYEPEAHMFYYNPDEYGIPHQAGRQQ